MYLYITVKIKEIIYKMPVNKFENLDQMVTFYLSKAEKKQFDDYCFRSGERSRSNLIRKNILNLIQNPVQQITNPQPIPSIEKSVNTLEFPDKEIEGIYNYMHERGLDCPVEAARELLSFGFTYIEEQQENAIDNEGKEDELFG